MSRRGVGAPPGEEAACGLGWRQLGPGMFVHLGRQLQAIRTQDMGRWHLSVAHRNRVPTWGELGFARDCLLPKDVWLMVPHPPREFWLNLDSRVLHLWEFRDPELIEQFQWEGEHAQQEGFGTPDDGTAPHGP